VISRARVDDSLEILGLQQLAYRSEAELYDDYSLPPLTQTLENLQAQFGSRVFLKAVEEGAVIGSVRAYQNGTTCYVERLIVHPTFRRRGIGTSLLARIEAEFPEARRFELFTGHKSAGNIRLYERAGYKVFKQEPVNATLTLVFMEKVK